MPDLPAVKKFRKMAALLAVSPRWTSSQGHRRRSRLKPTTKQRKEIRKCLPLSMNSASLLGHDATCLNVETHGYVGITAHEAARKAVHRGRTAARHFRNLVRSARGGNARHRAQNIGQCVSSAGNRQRGGGRLRPTLTPNPNRSNTRPMNDLYSPSPQPCC
jgi:hypothetical protein